MINRMNRVNGRLEEDTSPLASAVRYDADQIRSEEEKAQARANMGAIGAAELAETKADLEKQIENISGISDPEAVSQMVEDVAKHETDISDLKSSVSSQTHTVITNLGDGYFNGTNGELKLPTADQQKYTIDFIPVVYGEIIVATVSLSATKYRSISLMGYDADKNFIGRLALIDGGVFDTITLEHTIANASVSYVRYSFSSFGVLTSFAIDARVANTQILNTIEEKVTDLVEPISTIEGIGYQYLDTSKFALGYYNWNQAQTDIQQNSATANWYCMLLPEMKAGTYHYNRFFHTNFSFIRNLSTNVVVKMTDAGFVESDNATITINYPFRLYITSNILTHSIYTGMISDKELPIEYTYGYYKEPQFYVNDQNQKIWIVGEGYIPTIQEACNRASADDIIFIKCGTYTEQVSIWNKKLHLIGENKANTILIDHSGFYNTPPLEMSLGSLSNMTIIEDGSNPTGSAGDSGYMGAYCLHIEWEPSQTGEEFVIDNCDFINDIHAPLGCGLYQDYTVHFKNCSFRCNATAEGNMERGAFYFHTRSAENCTGQKMIVENCIISSAGTKWAALCGVPAGANNTGSATVRFSGCTVWNDNVGTADSVVYFDTTGGTNVLSLVNSYGNTVSALNN